MAGADLYLKLIGEQVKVVETLDKVVARLEKLEKGVDQVGDKAKKAEGKIAKAFTKMGKSAQDLTKRIVKVGVAMGAAGLVASIYKSVKAASSFETKMREVSTLLGDEAEPKMEKFNKAVRDMAKTTSATANELSAGLYQVISAGTKGTEDAAGAMKLLDAANKMSVAGVSDVFSAVDVLTTALNAWGASADDATKFSDQMFCVTGDTRVLLADGRYKRIDGLKDGAFIVSFDGKNFVPLWAEWTDQGVKETVELETRLGRRIKTTWCHPYLSIRIQKGKKTNPADKLSKAIWKKVSELKIGDRIAVPTSLPYFGKKKVKESEAALLGLWLAEGAVGTTAMGSLKYGDHIKKWAADFDCDAHNKNWKHPDKCPVWDVVSKSGKDKSRKNRNKFLNLLREYGVANCNAFEKHIPDEVFEWDRDSVATLLRWLFNGDGWLCDLRKTGRSGFQLGFCSASERLVRDISHLLLRFGIVGTVRYKYNKDYERTYWQWEAHRYIEVSRFVEMIGIDRPAASEVLKHKPKKQRSMWGVVEFDEIVSIEGMGNEHVYDLVVDKLHNFVAEDIIAHNTAIELGKLTLNDLSAGLGTVASAAAGAGLDFGEVNAALAAMTAAGVPPARAMTSLNAIIRVASKGSDKMDAAFKTASSNILREKGLLGVMEKLREVTEGDTIELQKLGIEQEAVTGLAVLAGTGIDKFRDALEKMGRATGSTEAAYKKMSGTFEFQTKKFWNVVNDVFISIGGKLMPMLIEKMEEIARWVSTHKKDIKEFIEGAMEMIITFGKFIIENGKEIAVLFAAIWISSLGPIGIVAAAITGIMLALKELGDLMDKVLGGGAAARIEGSKAWGNLVDDIREAAGLLEGQMLKTPQEWTSKFMPGYVPPGVEKKKKEKPPPPKGKGVKLLPEDVSAEGAPFGVGFMTAGVVGVLTRAGTSAGFALVDAVNARRAEVLKFADEFAARGVDSWYQKIGGPELETDAERRAYAFAEAQSKPGFWSGVATGFTEAVGARLEGLMMDVAGAVAKPAGQIGDLFGMAMAGASVEDVKGQAEQMVQFWEQLAENLGPVLDYLVEDGIPMIIDAFVEHVPDIIETVAEAVPRVIDVLVKEAPKIVVAIVEGLAKAIPDLLGIGGGPSVGGAITGAAAGAGAGFMVGGPWGAAIGGAVGLIASLFHEGGFVNAVDGMTRSAGMFAGAIRAHSGLFVRPGLSAGEVPAILEAGEGVIRKEVVAAMGGESAVNAQNRGVMPGGDTHVHMHTEHLYAKDAGEVVDDMQSEMWRRGVGRMRRIIGGDVVPGFRPQRA